MLKIDDYKKVVGDDIVEGVKSTADPLVGKHIVNINSTSSGGGVAEILNTLVILMNDLKIETGWRILKGSHGFFDVTKKFHNALQGEKIRLTDFKKQIYCQETERNAIMSHFKYHDLVMVHDPQPLALIDYCGKKQPWIWRCHIDIKQTHRPTWDFLAKYIKKYDGMVVSVKKYKKRGIKIPQFVIAPSIDPLSFKNELLSDSRCRKILSKNQIDLDKPIVCQVSRFDKWKNPIGVIKIFKKIKEKTDNIQLVMIGDIVIDDPEGIKVYNKLANYTKDKKDITLITKRDDWLVNALQRKSAVVLQNSVREGFALVVAEALWKKTPVVGTRVGGIPLQIIDGKTGFLISNTAQAAKRCVQLLQDEKLREKLGQQGHEHVKKNFLITRHLKDYLELFNHYLNNKKE